MRKIVVSILIAAVCLLLAVRFASADTSVAEASAEIKSSAKADYRVKTLAAFFEKYNSPLVPYAQKFIEEADKNSLDWRLLPAITGVESTFGKRIPYKSYNAYGWAGGKYIFASWDESIEIVSAALNKNYVQKGADSIAKIGKIYCPPNPAWAGKVKFFVEKIAPSFLSFTLEG